MTDIEKKALALLNEVRDERGFRLNVEMQREDMAQEALCRAIEQHEAFRQEVSDGLVELGKAVTSLQIAEATQKLFDRFIIPKTDPLVEVLQEISGEGGYDNFDHYAYRLRSALEARGLEVRKIGEKAGD